MSRTGPVRWTEMAALASVATALALILLKGFAWIQSGSAAILASLADSGLDLVASVVTLLSVRYAARPPDADHRFGHGKAEALAGVFQAGLVAVAGVAIAWTCLTRLASPQPVQAEGIALQVMVVSMLLTGALVWFQGWTLKKTGSIATKGDRAHYLVDFLSNGVALAGVGLAAWLGWYRADALAGLIVAAWLAHGAWGIAREAADHLLDREAPDALRDEVRTLALDDPRVSGIHDLRTRLSGPWLHVQFHLDLPPDLSLREAHGIVAAAERRIRARHPGADIIIHPDPGDAAEPHGHPEFGESRAETR